MKKLNWFAYQTSIIMMVCSLTSCSLVIPSAMTKTTFKITPETRRTEKKKDVELTFALTPEGDRLSFSLQYKPYYQEQHRSTTRYKWELANGKTVLAAGLLELVFGYMALFPDRVPQGDLEFRESLKKYQKPILIGIASDFLLSSFLLSYYYSRTGTESWDWKTSSPRLKPGAPINIANQPVSIAFPQFGYKDTYRTDYNGSFTIPTNYLINRINEISKISDLRPALETRSIKIDAFAKFDGEKAEESFTIYERERSSRLLFQALHKKAEKLRRP